MVSSITEGSGFVLDIIEQLKEPVNSHESRNDILPQNIVTENYATKQNNTKQAIIANNGRPEHEINDTLEVSETHSWSKFLTNFRSDNKRKNDDNYWLEYRRVDDHCNHFGAFTASNSKIWLWIVYGALGLGQNRGRPFLCWYVYSQNNVRESLRQSIHWPQIIRQTKHIQDRLQISN